MGFPFTDITLYAPTELKVGTPEFNNEVSLQNFVSDLYVQKMYGYKPPKTSRVTLQPAYHEIWNRTWKNGSIISIAPYFNYNEYKNLDKKSKYHYILDIVHNSMMKLSEEYSWNKMIFEKAYQEILESDFLFRIEYPIKISRDKKKTANLVIEKTETISSIYLNIKVNELLSQVKLFDKKNTFWYDGIYSFAKNSKWFDSDSFGINYKKKKTQIIYSIKENKVTLFQDNIEVKELDFEKIFLFG